METPVHSTIINTLCAAGYDTYIVGGAVRDVLSGNTPHDIDIATQATPTQVHSLFHNTHVTKLVGKSFGVVLVDGIEIATFRKDRHSVLLDARKTTVSFASDIHDDLSRRDLTINALAMCASTGDIIDNHGGVHDLHNNVIRFVGDASVRILEDPVRIIRACRFLAKIQGTFTTDTLSALQEHAHLVKTHVAPERIRLEVLKAMELDVPSLFFSALHVIGALQHIFPSLNATVDHPHGKWHVENVWEHCMLAGDYVSPHKPIERLAAYLHDVGKPIAYKTSYALDDADKQGTFHSHEVFSADLVAAELSALTFTNNEVQLISGIARAHMWCGHTAMSAKAIRKMLFRLNEYNVTPRQWLRVRIADRAASVNKDVFTLADIRERATAVLSPQVQQLPLSTHDLAVTGKDIIAMYGLSGKAIGELQRHLLSYVIDNGEEYNVKDVLLEVCDSYVSM